MLNNRVPRSTEDVLALLEQRVGRLERTGGRGGITTTPVVPPGNATVAADSAPATRDDGTALKPGDLWIDTSSNNRIYRWNGSGWVAALDPSVDQGRDRAAFDLASAQDRDASTDAKIVTFVQSSAPGTAANGDLWIDVDDFRLHRRLGGSWVATGDYATGASVLRGVNSASLADGRVSTWWQPQEPTADGFGDLWVDTGGTTQVLRRWNNYDWVPVLDWALGDVAEQVQTKASTWYEPAPPVATAKGDIWYNTADKNHPYRAAAPGASTIAPGEWESARDETIADAQDTADQALSGYSNEYAVGSSETVPPSTGWSTATPVRTPGTYIWFRTVVTRGDGTTSTTSPALLTGNDGATGDAGPQGVPGPPGENGQQLYTWVKYADTPTTGMSDSPTGKAYLGLAYNKTTATESTNYADYTWSLVKGADGADGDPGVPGPPGADGQTTYTWVKYGTSATGAGLSDDPTGKTYIGLAYNKTTPTESTVATDYQWALIQGPAGANAATVTLTATTQVLTAPAAGGATTPATSTVTGTAVNTTITAWTYSVDGAAFSATVPAGASRTGNVVTVTGATMTARTVTVRMADANGVADTLTVAKVLDGAAGSQGIQGPPGSNGQTLYTWIKYADSPTAGMSDLPTGKTYMGIAYNKTTATESSTYSDYDWSLIQGPQGNTGIQGPPGADGQPTYTWIKYGDSAAGAGLSDSPVGKTYIGIAYNKTTAAESTTPGDYEWSLIQGPQGPAGASAQTVTLTANTQVLTQPAAGGATSPATATVTGTAVNTTISAWDYSVDGGAFSTTAPAGVSRAGNVVTVTGGTMTARTITVRMGNGAGATDTLTVARVSDGAAGATGGTGGTGPSGADAYTVILSNESHTFPGSTTAAVAGSTTSQVIAYKGSAAQSATIGTITGQVTGLTTSVQNNGTATAGFTVAVSTSLTQQNGELVVPVTVDGVSFTKKFTWAVARTGATGSQGIPGTPGADGVTYYTWLKYASSATPAAADMSDSPAGKTYMGIAVGKTSPTESTVYTDYNWSLIQGPQGDQGIPGAPGADGSTTYTWVKYAPNGAPTNAQISDSPTGMTHIGLAFNKTTATESTVATDYQWSLIQGPQGADAYTVILTNEAHTFPGGTSAALDGSTTSQVIALKGAATQSATIGTITGQVTGLTTAVTNNGTATAGFTVTASTALTATSGVLTVPVTVDGQSFTKRFSWSVTRAGTNGTNGANAQLVTVTASAQVLTSPAAGGATNPATSVVSGSAQNTTIAAWDYSTDGGSTWSATPPAGASRAGNVVTITGSTMTARTVTVRMGNNATPGTGVFDTTTVAKVLDGAAGATGGTGAPGVGITSTVVEYQVGSSGTTAPTGTWQSSPQATSPGQYLWTRTRTNLSDSSFTYAYSVAAHGTTGATGTAGVGVSGTTVEYQVGTSGTTAPTGTWSPTPVATTAPGQYLWTRTTTAYTNSTSSLAYSVSAHGATGSTGAAGADAYTVVLSNEAQTFAAGTTNALGATASTTVIAYKGTALQTATVGTITGGATGITAAVRAGTNGTTAPVVDITVSTALTTPNGTFSIPVTVGGITMNQVFSWSLAFAGAAGANGAAGTPAPNIDVTATSQVLTAPAAGGATTPATSTVTGTATNTTITVWEYSVDGGAWTATAPAGASRTGNVVTITGASMTARTITVRMADAAGTADTLTVARSLDGATGGTGAAGADGYTVLLTNEAHSFPGTTTTAVNGATAATSVVVYKGGTQIASSITANSALPTGLAIAITGNGTTTNTATFTASNTLIQQNGVVDLTISADGKTFSKRFTWSVAYTGAAGAAATTVDLTATTQALVSPAAGGATTPATAVVTGAATNTTIPDNTANWQYSVNGAAFSSTVPAGVSRTASTVTITGATMTAQTIAVKAIGASGASDTLTVAKVLNGATGGTGGAGADAYTVILGNEAHTFAGTATAAAGGTATVPIIVYKGATQIVSSVTSVTAQGGGALPTGLTAAITNNGATTNTVTFTATTALTAQNGVADITISADGKTFVKKFSWAVSRTGTTGTSVTSITPYYAQVATAAAAPAQPGNVATPPAPWVATEPAYAYGTKLYRTDRVAYSDGTYAYTAVTLSSAYAAATAAMDEAVSKNSVYRSPTAPWGTTSAEITAHASDVGDLWFDTTLTPGPQRGILSWSATSNVVTMTSDSDHGLSAGKTVAVDGVDPAVDGVYAVASVPTATTFTFPLTIANRAETPLEAATMQGMDVQPLNRINYWSGSAWVTLQDAGIADLSTLTNNTAVQVSTQDERLTQTEDEIETLRNTALDAQGTAYAADGRVSISDYEPSPSDVEGKNDGSLWITRTRDRVNLCVNPSFEASAAFWSASATTAAQVATAPAGDGAYALRLTNTSSTTSLHAAFPTTRLAISPGQDFTASGYGKLVSGSGAGQFARLDFYDAAGTIIAGASVDGPATDTNVDDWVRLYATGVAPDNAASVLPTFASPAANASAVWMLDAVLFELSDRLGRYFDGGSEGGSWQGTAELSPSDLDGNAIIRLFTLEDNAWAEKFWTADTISSVNASTIDRGAMDGGFIKDNSIPVDKVFMPTVPASETLFPGAIVNVWDNNGVPMVRLAKAVLGYEATGFVLESAVVGQQITVYTAGYNPLMGGMSPGTEFLSTTPGYTSASPPSETGTVIQRVGSSVSPTTLNFAALTSVSLT